MATAPIRDALLGEKQRLEGNLASLQRDWNNAPKLLLLCVLAVPIGLLMGPGWAVLFAVLVASLAGTVLYLVGVRRKEYQHELDEVLKRIDAGRQTP